MPRQNRVTPFGEIIACPERGTLMGNRGILHDESGSIRRSWTVRRWLICLLEFRGRHRTVMTPHRYTELFFLDEATGLAAGHRPAAECQRRRYNEFRAAWAVGNLHAQPPALSLRSRSTSGCMPTDSIATRSKRTFRLHLDDLPDGVFITREGSGRIKLYSSKAILCSSGRQEAIGSVYAEGTHEVVSVLTPESTVAAIRSGIHPCRFIRQRLWRDAPIVSCTSSRAAPVTA